LFLWAAGARFWGVARALPTSASAG
jgi:hypothetical protein